METKYKILSFVALFFLVSATVSAASTNPFPPNLASAGYKSPINPYNYGQCTWFAFGRAYEHSVTLPKCGNAKDWYTQLKYPTGSTPKANSIAVWSGGPGGLGHVAYVERVDGDLVYINEANVFKSGAYDGNCYQTTSTAMVTRGSLNLRGYVYLPIISPPTLIRVAGTTVYHVDINGNKAWVPTANVFNSWKWDWSLIKDITQNQFNQYPNASPSTIVFKDGTFIKYNNDIAIIQAGKRCQFSNWQAYLNHGGSPTLAGVYTVNAYEWSLNAPGSIITK